MKTNEATIERGAGSISVKRLTMGAVFMSMVIVLSSFSVPVPGGHLYINDIAICLAALLFLPKEAFIIGGVGTFLGDFFFYPLPMFVSLATHGIQAWVISDMVRRFKGEDSKAIVIAALLVGAFIMVLGYTLGRAYVYSTPEYSMIKLPWEILQAMTGVVVGYILYFHTSIRKAWDRYIG